MLSGIVSEFSKDSSYSQEPFKSNEETSEPWQTAFKEAQPGPSVHSLGKVQVDQYMMRLKTLNIRFK